MAVALLSARLVCGESRTRLQLLQDAAMCQLAQCVTAPEAFLLLRLFVGIAKGMSCEGAEEQCNQVQAEVLGRDWYVKQ